MSQPAARFCPILTAAVARPPSDVLTASGQPNTGIDAVPCTGPACMLFVPMTDEHGKIVGGHCAVSLIPIQLANATSLVAAALSSNKGEVK